MLYALTFMGGPLAGALARGSGAAAPDRDFFITHLFCNGMISQKHHRVFARATNPAVIIPDDGLFGYNIPIEPGGRLMVA
ncbi:hypothetical protein D5085_04030 [Ectothiorhodospiraceae bacterium BW-2]|nr:hypothetical protein D5085_04030 [Ectothiorhodospiraceae bacterium BW-2]